MGVDAAGLFNAISSTFVIIGLGYFLPALGWLPKDVGKSLSPLVGKLLLPCLLFLETSTLDLGSIRWSLVGAIVLAKMIACTLALLMWRLFDKTLERTTNAAMAAIFIGNQNDLAMGLAVVPVLFPAYKCYLYVLAIYNLVVIVPACIVLIEVSQSRRAPHASSSCKKSAVRTLFNPLVFSSIIGLLYKIVLSSHVEGGLPTFVSTPLETVKAAFPCCALFLVGHGLLVKGANSDGDNSFWGPLFLAGVKLVFTPICTQLCIRALTSSCSDTDLEFGYLYGTLPAAPSTIVVASGLGLPVQSLCRSTLFSIAAWAPLCFIGAIVFASNLNEQLEESIRVECIASNVLSIMSLLLSLWSIIPSGAWRTFSMTLPFIMIQLAFHSGDLACRFGLDSNSLFFVLCCFRLGVMYFGCLFAFECVGVRARWLLVMSVAACLAIPAIVIPYAGSPEPLYKGRCWWRSYKQEQCEVYFYAAITAVMFALVLYVAKLRRMNTQHTDVDHGVSELTSIEGQSEILMADQMSGDASSLVTSCFPTILEKREERQSAPTAIWLVQALSMVGISSFLYFVLLVLVDDNNRGAAGFSVILLLQSAMASGMGFFFCLVLFQKGAQTQCFRFIRRRFAVSCPIFFEADIRIAWSP
eukprot:TRINITY_DN23375_c2_g1_i2.p1 TRINITY_DN23375_c2_g1~~TRINITY_DN23375_c2_g1_i2.p1  ORF type:complete len:640 (-),score=41.16 TRINITY_DN23375_c2_g1_i2:320-2239(-)